MALDIAPSNVMAYTIQAIITPDSMPLAGNFDAESIQLSNTLTIVPLRDAIREDLGIPSFPLTDDEVSEVPSSLDQLGAKLSRGDHLVVYVELEIFGGVGNQAMIAWENGIRTDGPICARSAINEGLLLLGVSNSQQTPFSLMLILPVTSFCSSQIPAILFNKFLSHPELSWVSFIIQRIFRQDAT